MKKRTGREDGKLKWRGRKNIREKDKAYKKEKEKRERGERNRG